MYEFFAAKTLLADSERLWAEPTWVPPPNFRPICAYGFMRHGLRYQARSWMQQCVDFIESSQFPPEMDTPTPRPDWPPLRIPLDMQFELCPAGQRESHALGARLAARLPAIFRRPIALSASRENRAVHSALAFASGAEGRPEVSRSEVSKYHVDWSEMMKNYKTRDHFERLKSARMTQRALYMTRDDYRRVYQEVSARLPEVDMSPEVLDALHCMAADGYTIFGEFEPFAPLFGAKNLALLELFLDIEDYYNDIHPYWPLIHTKINPVIGEFCAQIEHALLDQSASATCRTHVTFSHSHAFKLLLASLGLFDGLDLTFDLKVTPHMSPEVDRVYRMAKLCPNNASVIFVALLPEGVPCAGASREQLKIAVLLQERVIKTKANCDAIGLINYAQFRAEFIEKFN